MSEPLSDHDLAAIERRLAQISPGPWRLDALLLPHTGTTLYDLVAGDDRLIAADIRNPSDAAILMQAPDDLQRLVAEVRRLRERGPTVLPARWHGEGQMSS